MKKSHSTRCRPGVRYAAQDHKHRPALPNPERAAPRRALLRYGEHAALLGVGVPLWQSHGSTLQRRRASASDRFRLRRPRSGRPTGDLPLVERLCPRASARPRTCPHGDADVAGTTTAGLSVAQLVSRSLVANSAGVRIGRLWLRTSRSLSPVTRYARRSIASARR